MSRNSPVYFILWILIQVLVKVNCQLTPSVYSHHTATHIDNKLYILGGQGFNDTIIKEFIYLDVSVSFNTQELSWQNLTKTSMVPAHHSATAFKGGVNNDTLFLYGGSTPNTEMELVYTFDSHRVSWSIPKITGIINTDRKCCLTAIVNNDGRAYLWSGYTGTVYPNDMFILDTINLSWSKGSIINAPIPRDEYGATLLPNNKIIYMGGTNMPGFYDPETLTVLGKGGSQTLSEVYIYDTINDSWETKATSGKIPTNRGGFSTVLALDGQRTITFGGYFFKSESLDTALYVLDLNNYNWYVPKISGKIPNPRVTHKANVIGKYMVVSFGLGYNKSVESDILLLDISNNEEYIWTTTFDPNMPSPSPSPPSSPPGNMIAGVVVGSLLSGILLSAILSFFIYKWNKNRQKQKTIYGNENNNDYSKEKKELPITRDIKNYEQAINENTSNHEQIIPTNDRHRQEIIQTLQNEGTTNHEPTTPAPAVVNTSNYNYEQEVNSTPNNNKISSQIFKDEILQAVKNEIGQNLKNEILQAVKNEIGQNLKNDLLQAIREENVNNLNITRQD